MRNLFNFGTGHGPNQNGPRSSARSPSLEGRGVRFGEPGRSWCGLPRQPEPIDLDRVAIQRAFRFGLDAQGKTVGVEFYAPEFCSHERALRLVSSGQARFCGLAGEGK